MSRVVRYLLVTFLATEENYVLAVQDEDTYNRCKELAIGGVYRVVDIPENAAKALLEAHKGIGVGCYLADLDNAIETDVRRSNALHRYVRFMYEKLGEIALHEPVKLTYKVPLQNFNSILPL